MAILAVSNLAMDWGGLAEDTTDLLERDPAYSPTGIVSLTNTPMSLQPFPAATGDLWIHFKWRMGSQAFAGGSDGHLFSLYMPNGTLVARLDATNGQLRPEVFGDSTVQGPAINMTSNLVQTLDFRISVDPSSITMDYYIGGGGAPVSSATAVNTVGGKTMPVQMTLDLNDISNITQDFHFSEFIITDNEDTRGWRLATLEPNANGNYNEWLGDIAELGDRDPATSTSSNTGGQRQSWTPTAYAGPTTVSSIRAVIAKAQTARGAGASPSQIAQFLRIAGVDYDGANNAFLAGERKDIIEVWDDNPATTSPWTTADLATIEAGLLSVT